MNARCLLALLLCAISTSPLKAADEVAGDRFPLLARLTPPEAALPPGCSIPEGRPPVRGLQNRSITTNAQAFLFVDRQLTELLAMNIQAMYYAVYWEKGELGVFGWAFTTEETAKQARDRLAEKRGDRFRVWLSQKYVLCLWRDVGATGECFKYFKDFLNKRVGEAARTTN